MNNNATNNVYTFNSSDVSSQGNATVQANGCYSIPSYTTPYFQYYQVPQYVYTPVDYTHLINELAKANQEIGSLRAQLSALRSEKCQNK